MKNNCLIITGYSSDITKFIIDNIKSSYKEIIYFSNSKEDFKKNIYLKKDINNSFFVNKIKKFNYVDIVHLAGKIERKSIKDISDSDWQNFFDIHLYYLHNIISVLMRNDIKIHSLIAISTCLTKKYNKNNYLYICSKSALESYIKQIAYNEGILANIISPEYFKSKMNNYEEPKFNKNNINEDEITSKNIAEIIEFLLIKNKIISGENIYLDYGSNLGY